MANAHKSSSNYGCLRYVLGEGGTGLSGGEKQEFDADGLQESGILIWMKHFGVDTKRKIDSGSIDRLTKKEHMIMRIVVHTEKSSQDSGVGKRRNRRIRNTGRIDVEERSLLRLGTNANRSRFRYY